MIERFILRRWRVVIETWQLGLLLIISALGVLGFSALVEHASTDPYRSGRLSKIALGIARIPATVRPIIRAILNPERAHLARYQRFEGEAGLHFESAGGRVGDLLVLSRYDADKARSVVELVDMETGEIVHIYEPDINAIHARSKLGRDKINLARDHAPHRYSMYHPLLVDDGGLIFHGEASPLVKVDLCSQIEWTIDGLFHHSTERGVGDSYWTVESLLPSTVKFTSADFHDNAITQVSADGDVLFRKSVAVLLIENGLEHLVYSGERYYPDVVHLNDVQPVLEDSAYWKRGDVFLSLRNLSAIVLYRPSTNEVLWVQKGPWLGQHDVDVISDHEIAVFNNRRAVVPGGERTVGLNEVVVYDFDIEETRSPYSEGFRRQNINTSTAGLSSVLPNGDIFVEEQNFGRLLAMSPEGDLRWRYINRASDGLVYRPLWSTYLIAEKARPARTALEERRCTG